MLIITTIASHLGDVEQQPVVVDSLDDCFARVGNVVMNDSLGPAIHRGIATEPVVSKEGSKWRWCGRY